MILQAINTLTNGDKTPKQGLETRLTDKTNAAQAVK